METCKIKYIDSHVYYFNLNRCLSILLKAGAKPGAKFLAQRDLASLLINELSCLISEDDRLIIESHDSNDNSIKNVLLNKVSYEHHVPSLLRSVTISTRSGLPDRSYLLKLKENKTDLLSSELKILDISLPKDLNEIDETIDSLVNEASISILSGNIDSAAMARGLLMRLRHHNSIERLKNISISNKPLTHYDYNNLILYKNIIQELVNDKYVCLTISFSLKKKKNIFENIGIINSIRTPLGNIIDSNFIPNVDEKFSNLVHKIIGCKSSDVYLVMSTLNEHGIKRGNIITPDEVLSCTIGPYIFWGNAQYHSTESYMERFGVATESELLSKSPSAFSRGFVGDQIIKYPHLFALFSSGDSTSIVDEVKNNEIYDNVYCHPNLELPKINVLGFSIEKIPIKSYFSYEPTTI